MLTPPSWQGNHLRVLHERLVLCNMAIRHRMSHTPCWNVATPVIVRWQMTVHHPSFAIHHPSFAVHHPSLIVSHFGVSPGSVAIQDRKIPVQSCSNTKLDIDSPQEYLVETRKSILKSILSLKAFKFGYIHSLLMVSLILKPLLSIWSAWLGAWRSLIYI